MALAPAPPPQPQHLHRWLVPHYDVPTDVGTPWRLVDWDGTNQGTAHVKSVLRDRKNHDQHVRAKMLHVVLALISCNMVLTASLDALFVSESRCPMSPPIKHIQQLVIIKQKYNKELSTTIL